MSKVEGHVMEQVRDTDMAPVVRKTVKPVDLRIERIGRGEHVRITSRGGEIDQIEPFVRIEKRWPRAERIAYFRGQISANVGALEIGEAFVPGKPW